MAPRTARRLFDLDVDEISAVDRPANQHADVVIAKRAGDPMPEQPVYDDEGYELDTDALEPGDRVWLEGEDGQLYEHVMVDDVGAGEYADDGYDGDYAEDYADSELAGVGKSVERRAIDARNAVSRMRALGAEPSVVRTRARVRGAGVRARNAAQGAASSARGAGRSAASSGRNAVTRGRQEVRGHLFRNSSRYRAGGVGAGAGLAAGGAGGYEFGEHRKSLGASVYEELSKALRESDRDDVIAKFADYVEDAQAQADEAWQIAKGLQDERDLVEFVDIARGYRLPGDPVRLGGILKRCAETMGDGELAELDRTLSAAGAAAEFGKELGYGGSAYAGGGVYDEIAAIAREAVGKAAGELSTEAAITALFEANPASYDEFLAEQAQARRF